MELTQDDVIHILKLIDQAPVGHFSLQVGDLKLEVAKGDGPSVLPAIQSAPPVAQVVATADSKPSAVPSGAGATASATAAPAEVVGLVIKAPILGTFYRRSQPGVPAYVEEGSLVEEDTTVALIEVMKLFNPVKAGVKGRIIRISAENGSLVEYGQELFRVEPA